MTEYLQVDASTPQAKVIELAAEFIKAGELVAFPTETVYGLGADALQPDAVEKIFVVKGRPPENALLIHVSSMAQVQNLAAEVPPVAQRLIDQYWPGPLSIILPARITVPHIVTGGSSTVGLRMPSHPVALALIEVTGPLAAPSANLYGRPSPLNADHVRQDLDDRIAAVLDAGETGGGLESTLIDLSSGKYRILRRGSISVEALEDITGQRLDVDGVERLSSYKTKVQVVLSDSREDFQAKLDSFLSQDRVLGVVHIYGNPRHRLVNIRWIYELNLSGQGMNLYSILRDAEDKAIETLLFEPVDSEQTGADPAIIDRVRRAGAKELL